MSLPGINIGSGFIQDQDAVVFKDGPGKADKLSLTHAEVRTPFSNLHFKFSWWLLDYLTQLNLNERNFDINSIKTVLPLQWKQILNPIQSPKAYIYNLACMRWDLSFNLIPYMLQENAKWRCYGHLIDLKSILKNCTNR